MLSSMDQSPCLCYYQKESSRTSAIYRARIRGSLRTGTGPLVFETFKPEWEIYQDKGAPPSDWNSFGGENPCNIENVKADTPLILVSSSKFGELGQAGMDGQLVGPLVAQNGTYTRFQTLFNQVEFNQIQSHQWYLRSKLPDAKKGDQPLTFNPDALGNNPIDIKASWMDMTKVPNPERYYTRKAWLFDMKTEKCEEKTVGLVGLHIVTKTASSPQWIWSTFEHVDNAPDQTKECEKETGAASPTSRSGGTRYAYNDNTGACQPRRNPHPWPPPNDPPPPFNVFRIKPISDSTKGTNDAYRKVLASQGNGVWQNYQLVMTQWPVPLHHKENDGRPPHTFPGKGNEDTSFANTTMETFDQKRVEKGCMNCHTGVQKNADFLWALYTKAYPPDDGVIPSHPRLRVRAAFGGALDPKLKQLEELMSLPDTPPKPAQKVQKTTK